MIAVSGSAWSEWIRHSKRVVVGDVVYFSFQKGHLRLCNNPFTFT